MVYRRNEPYNDLPLLPPAYDLETVPVMRRCIAANRFSVTRQLFCSLDQTRRALVGSRRENTHAPQP